MAAPFDPLLLIKYRGIAQALRNEPDRTEFEGFSREVLLRDLRTLGAQLNLPARLFEQGQEPAFLNALVLEIDRTIEEVRAAADKTPEDLVKKEEEAKERPERTHGGIGKETEFQRTTSNLRRLSEKVQRTVGKKLRHKLSQFRKNLPERRTVVNTAGKLSHIGARATVQGGRTIASFFRLPGGGLGGIFRAVIGGIANIARGFLTGLVGVGTTAVGGIVNPVTGIIVIVVIVLILILTFFIILVSLLQTNLITLPPAKELIQCTFVRDSLRIPPNEGKIKSSILASLIQDVGQRARIPAPIIAAVAFVENSDFVKNAGDDHDGILNNYYYYVSQVNQTTNRETNAIGLMQISTGRTPTSRGVVDHCDSLMGNNGALKRAADKLGKRIHDEAGDGGKSYYCIFNSDERIKRFCQTNRTEKNTAYYSPDVPPDDSYINLCRLQDNLMVGAEILNNKLPSGGSWLNETDVNGAISGYYGACNYGTGNYCNEVWSSFQACQATQVYNPTLGGGAIPPGKVVYYCQGNTLWKNTCQLGNAGCGPTSLAMVLSTFGITMTPPEVDNVFRTNGWRSCGDYPSNMLNGALASSWLFGLGFEVGPDLTVGSDLNNKTLDGARAKDFIDNGYLIIASSKRFPCANCSSATVVDHIFVVDGIDLTNNKIDVRDPNNCSYTDGNDENLSKRIKNINDFPWYYAKPIKKVR